MTNGKSISSAEQLIANIDKKERVAFKRFFFKIFLIALFLFILFATLNLGKADFGSVNLPVFAMSVFVASIPTGLFACVFYFLNKNKEWHD